MKKSMLSDTVRLNTKTMQVEVSGVPHDARPRNAMLWTGIGLVLGIILIAYVLRSVDLGALLETITTVEPGWAASVLALQMVFVVLKACRWHLLLHAVPDTRLVEIQRAVFSGLALNYLIMHLGELWRTATVAMRCNSTFSAVLATVFVERVFDFMALLFIIALVGFVAPELSQLYHAMAAFTAAVIVLAAFSLYFIVKPPAWLLLFVQRIALRLPAKGVRWIEKQLLRFRSGVISLFNFRLNAYAALISILQWIAIVLVIWFSGFAVGFSVTLLAATVTFLLVVLGQQLPNSPLQLGANQVAFVIGMGTDGIGATPAVAASLVFTFFALFPTLLIGGGMLLADSLSSKQEKEDQSAV